MNVFLLWLQCGTLLCLIQGLCIRSSYAHEVTSFVNESASIIFSFPERENSVTFWEVNNKFNLTSTVQCFGKPCSCNADGFLISNDLYSITCGKTFVNVTIKHVQLEQHDDRWLISELETYIYDEATLYVNVRVSSVSLTSIANIYDDGNYNLTLNETNVVNIQCQSSLCRPNATVFLRATNDSQQNIIITAKNQSYISNSGLWQTSALFQVKFNKSLDDWNLSCIAENDPGKQVTSARYSLHIQYPPEKPPAIQGFNNESVYTIIENNKGQLVCSVERSNPPTELKWIYENRDTIVSEVSDGTSTTINWTASRNKNLKYTCRSNHILTRPQNVSVNVNVLYPPDQIDVSLNMTGTVNSSILTNFSVIADVYLIFRCKGTGNPAANSFLWSGLNNSSSLELQLRPVGGNSGNITCFAFNTMNESANNKTVKGNLTKTYFVDVLFPPKLSLPMEHRVIERTNVNVSCATSPGNSNHSNAYWTPKEHELHSDSSIFHIDNVTRSHQGMYTCSVNYSMHPTYGEMEIGITNTTLYLEVLYPPENVTVNLRTANYTAQTIKRRISVMEKTNLTFSCSAQANPAPYKYSWSGLESSDSNILELRTVKNKDGNITCFAVNYMNASTSSNPIEGQRNETYFLDILYSPVAEPLGMLSAIEGDYFNKTCKVLSGKTSSLSVMWTENSSTVGENSSLFVLPTVTRNQTGNYTCEINYTMVPTYAKSETGQIKLYMHLDVLYRPENIVIRLKIGVSTDEVYFIANKIIVIEHSPLVWHCSASGKPEPRLYWSGRVSNNSEVLQFVCTRKLAGSFTCNANNTMNRSHGDIVIGYSSQTIHMDTLYPPELRSESVITETEGSTVTLRCLLEQGRTTTQTVQWTKNGDVIWHEDSVTFSNVTILSSGNYTCEVDYFMVPSYGEPMHGMLRKEIYLKIVGQTASGQAKQGNSTAGPITGALIGSIIFIVGIVTAVTLVRKRKMRNMPHRDKHPPEYQNMSFMKVADDKQHKRLPPVPFEDVHDTPERQHQQLNTDQQESNTRTLKTQQTPQDVKKHPVYQNMNFMEDVKQHKRLHPVPIEDGRKEHDCHMEEVSEGPDSKTRKMQQKRKEVKQHSDYENMNSTNDVNHHTRLPPMIPTKDSYEVPDQVYGVDISRDENQVELLEIIHTISLSDLFSYVTSKSAEDYFQEYARFPQGMISSIPYTFSRRPQNAPLNRYQGIYPYDHSRVVIPGEPDFFINANYIDGHSKERAYIASLGPTVRHCLGFQTFWKMVWNEKSDVIVMLTNLQEPSGMKCEKYWADYGTTREVGEFIIRSVTEEIAAEYTVRTFNVLKKGKSRSVTQLHYTAWPDKKVPEDVTSLIEFWQRVKAAPTRSLGPLVVHCSAGIGRTGTYLALDRLFQEGKTTGSVNVFECVMSMRQQRVNMVQTQDQYVYLHQALVHSLVFDTEPVTADKIEDYVQTTSHNVYIKLFEQLKQSVEVESTYEEEARTRNCDDDERNRTQADIPGDAHRIRLFLDKESDESDYINAVYLNSFRRLGHFIIAQSPLSNTLDDFVLMLYQENCCCIVSLDDYQQKGTNNAAYLPPENQHATYGSCTISSTMLDSKSAYSVRKLKIGHSSRYEKGMKIAHHFEYTGWKQDERIPKDVNMFVEFVQEVEEYATQLADEHSHVLVHCLTGSGRSGLFCAVSNLIQKMGQDRQVSVVNTLRQVRARRKTAIRNTEQLKFCYQAVYAFVKNYKV